MTYFIVTVDTEEAFEWGKDFRTKYIREEVSYIKELLKFQDLCDRYQVKPTYLVDYPILANKGSLKVIKQLKKRNCELGTHLHTWCNPPFEEKISIKTTYLENLDPKLMEKKMKNLTNRFEQTLNNSPRAFKSGRYSISDGLFEILIKQGYKVDTSLMPFTDLTPYGGSPKIITKFRPFKIKVKKGELLEIPATVGFNFNNFNFCNKNNLLIQVLKRVNIIRRIRLSPEYSSVKDMKKICEIYIKKKAPILHFQLHSSDFVMGKTPNVKNKKELINFYKSIEQIFEYAIHNKNCKSIGCSEVKITSSWDSSLQNKS